MPFSREGDYLHRLKGLLPQWGLGTVGRLRLLQPNFAIIIIKPRKFIIKQFKKSYKIMKFFDF